MKLLQLLPRFRNARCAFERLAGRESWSRAEVEAFQLERLNTLWSHAIRHVPWYARLAIDRSLPPRFESLTDFTSAVPLLPKETVVERTRDFLSDAPLPGTWHRTSGSTGIPAEIFVGTQAHLETLQCAYRFHQAWGIDILDRKAFLWGRAASHGRGLRAGIDRARQRMEDRLRNRLRLSAYRLDGATLSAYLKDLERFRPAMLYGYSSAMYLLAAAAARRGYDPEPLKLAVLTAEPASPEMVATIERSFGVPVAIEYGATECAAIAHEWPDRTLRVREDLVLLETPARADGRYDIVLSVLNNPSFPLLRYRIADMTDAPLRTPDRGFAILQNVVGRAIDLVRGRSGAVVHADAFGAILKSHRAVQRFRVHQRRDGSLSVFLEVPDPESRVDVRSLRERFSALVEGLAVDIEVVPTIPSTIAGKHRWAVSDFTDL